MAERFRTAFMNQTQKEKYWQEGVGLVEIAIALVIIGILMGALLQGKHLIDQARLNAIIRDVQKIRLDVQHFQEKHGFLPGDFPYASRDIHEDLVNGDGVGMLSGNPFTLTSSSGRFWSHLKSENGLIPPAENQTLRYGDGLIESGLGGGYTVAFDPVESMQGPWIVLGSKSGESSGEGALLTPAQASYINKKIGSGSPTSGSVRSLDSGRLSLGKCVKEGRYNLSNSEKSCVMYFSFDE